MTSAPPPGLTVDQLAARVGMTVRNVRAYAARGLLPAPRIVGRTGYYGPEHVARLTLVREMLDEGYTLAAVERALQEAPSTASAATLALHRAMLQPWLPPAPEETDLVALAARAGVEEPTHVVDELAQMGVLEVLQDGRVRVLDPTLLSAGVQVVRLGVPAEALVEAQRCVVELVEEAADVYVRMFRDTVWQAFLDGGASPEDLPRLQQVVEALQPAAAQALLASFRTAMAAAVADELDVDLAQLAEGRPDRA